MKIYLMISLLVCSVAASAKEVRGDVAKNIFSSFVGAGVPLSCGVESCGLQVKELICVEAQAGERSCEMIARTRKGDFAPLRVEQERATQISRSLQGGGVNLTCEADVCYLELEEVYCISKKQTFSCNF